VRYLTEGPIRGYERNGFGLCLAERKEDGTPIGGCGLIQREALEDVDIGFALLPSYEGQGYAFEAASATMAYGRNVLKLKRIVAIVTPDNARSIRLLERLGLSYERRITWADDGVELSVYAWGVAAP
jgi:RimJ/RimL family protein N-acetyltransferase